MIDHHQNQMIMLFTYSDTLWFNLRNDFISSSWKSRQNYWNLYLYRNSYRFRFFSFSKTTGTTHRIELIDLGVENTEIPTLLFDNSSMITIIGGHPEYESFKPITRHTRLYQEELNSFDYVKGDTEE
jgi:hypothetical protein